MKKPRILCRTIVLNGNQDKVLLVRNKGESYWYPPGGGWESDDDSLKSCAKREVFEETGTEVDIRELFYVQEFHHSEEKVFFEFFWIGILKNEDVDFSHKDLDKNGAVEEFKWFDKESIKDIKVFPKILKGRFWDDIDRGAPDNVYLQ